MGLFDSGNTQEILPAVGKPSGFFEGIAQGYEQQYRVDSPYSLEAEVVDAWKETIDLYRERTGEQPGFAMDMAALNSYARTLQGEDISVFQQGIGGGVPKELQENISKFQAFNEALKASGDPDFKSFEQVLEEVFAMQQDVEEQSALLGETGGVSGAIGQFIGATAGTLTTRDPLTLGTLGLGGIGKTVLARVASSGAVSGGLTAVTELGAVQANRELAGLQERDPFFDIAVAAAAGGVFQGAEELVSRLLRGRAARRAEAERPAPDLSGDLQDPRLRAARHIFEMEEVVIKKSPYGEGRKGLRRFTAELEEVQGIFAGKTDTAVARVLPPIPYEELKKAADFDIVSEIEPVIYARLEAAQVRLEEARGQFDELENTMPTVEDAIDSIDPDTGTVVRSLLDDLDQPGLTTQRRQEIEGRLARITETLDEAVIDKRLNDIQIGPKKQLQFQRKSIRAANKEYKKAYAEVEAVRARIVREQEQTEIVQQALFAQDLAKTVVAGRAPVQMARVSGDAAEAIALRLEGLESDVEAVATIGRFDESATDIDIGLEEPVSLDMQYIDTDGNTRSVRDIMKELQEDQRLDEAMRSCLL